jgi:glycosyltransferase involved in cell wall biosynthesis
MRTCIFVPNIIPGRSGGVETYVSQLIRRLQHFDSENEYSIVCSSANSGTYPLSSTRFQKKILNAIVLKLLNAVDLTSIPLRRYIASGIYKGLGLMKGASVLHYPQHVFPHVMRMECPVIITVVDIIHEFFPGNFSMRDLKRREVSHRPSAEAATRIIAISDFTKKTLMEKYGIDSERISVVHLGCDEAFDVEDPVAMEGVKRKYDLPERFLLYTAATWPHKNHINLIRGMKILKEKYGFRDKLILTGFPVAGHDEIMSEISASGLSEDVRFIGYVPERELPPLFKLATLMVFPSLFEGFGIPVVEAMKAGLPVASSNAASLPEVGGDAVLYFDPENPEDISRKVMTLIEDRDMRGKLVERGIMRASQFTWEKTAVETLKVYKEVCGR